MGKYELFVDFNIYNKELIELLYKKRLCGMPLSFYLLDLRKTNTYCHLNSSILAYFLEGSVKMCGDISSISGDDKGHSWVENCNYVYDTTTGIMWKKSSFYDNYKPSNVTIHPRQKVEEEIEPYLKYDHNMNEMYVAWIQDIMNNLGKNLYKRELTNHIDRFAKEKKLDKQKIDSELVDEFLHDLLNFYNQIDDFVGITEDSVIKHLNKI